MIKKSNKLNVYLGDITHDTIISVSDTIPINIGYVGSYMKKIFGEKVKLTLFKYPNDIISAIKKNPPDMLGLSNYSWNSYLSELIASIAKKYNSNVITAQGGPNFPNDEDSQIKFLSKRPATDIYTYLEGEKSCSNIVQRIFECDKNREKIFEKPIDGCMFFKPETKNVDQKVFVKGKSLERIKNLDEVPSPYLTGLLDKFFDGNLTPYLETNRGCPFTCAFCHTGNNYFHKINKFSEARIRDEIEYIGKRAKKQKVTNLHLADVNFGMYPADRKICEFLLESKKKYGWPLQIMGTTGKNSKERVMEITKILGNMFAINMATQSMDEQVLKNVGRANIKLDHMIEINNKLRKDGRSTHGELILPLPGETKETFIKGLNMMLNSNVSSVCIYTLILLFGTEFKNPEYRNKFKYKGKFRIVPLNFREYDGHKIFDYEEVGVETKDLSFDDYFYLRALALLVESLHNDRPFNEFFKYAQLFDIQPGTMIKILYDNISLASENIQKIIKDFISETKNELWNSGEDVGKKKKKNENYLKLKNGEVGGNLIYKYKSKSLLETPLDWINFIEKQVFEAIQKKQKNIDSVKLIRSEISEIANFCRLKIKGLLNVNANIEPIKGEFQFDLIKWIDDGAKARLSNYKFPNEKEKFYFEFSSDQIKMRDDVFKRYGTDINALSKIVTRISSLESQFRKIRYDNGTYLRDIYTKVGEKFTRYALSG
jgi:radical SAM superfamily enzyme YgiQ (UPF0313 family)